MLISDRARDTSPIFPARILIVEVLDAGDLPLDGVEREEINQDILSCRSNGDPVDQFDGTSDCRLLVPHDVRLSGASPERCLERRTSP